MLDNFNREINYLRISLTDKCNLFCRYCRDEKGVKYIPHKDILTLEEIYSICQKAVIMGIDKIRFTGGEPLVRKNVVHLIEKVVAIKGLKDVSLTTNGTFLKKFALPLKNAGLKRINVSLDTLDPQKYAYITRVGKLSDVLEGIAYAKELGFDPIKINMVNIKGFNDSSKEIDELKSFCAKNGFIYRIIEEMNLADGVWNGLVSSENSTVGICEKCNKLRITCDGKIRPCLFSDLFVDLKKYPFEEAIKMALQIKPENGYINSTLNMSQIGG